MHDSNAKCMHGDVSNQFPCGQFSEQIYIMEIKI